MKKKTAVAAAVLITAAVAVTLAVLLAPDLLNTGTGGLLGGDNGYSVIGSEAEYVEYAVYDNGIVSAVLPSDWVVDVSPSDYCHYMLTAYNPNNTDFRIFCLLECGRFIKTEEMKRDYSDRCVSIMSELPVMDPATSERFYGIFGEAVGTGSDDGFDMPSVSDFRVIGSFGGIDGGEAVRAVFVNENGRTADGVFYAGIAQTEEFGVSVVTVRNAVFFTAPESRLIEWEPILNLCVGTIRFSEAYAVLCGASGEEPSVPTDGAAFGELADLIASSWASRDPAYDVENQKQSDLSHGFERILDTETGGIYRADAGFAAAEPAGRFVPVADEMYLTPVDGYICRN